MSTRPMPKYYDGGKISEVYTERASLVATEAEEYKQRWKIEPAARDKFKIAAFGIDCQIGFCTPGSSLFVPGAVEDTSRTLGWLYENMDKLTGLHFSMDTHRVFQIFHPAWWIDAQGRHPPPLTAITTADIRSGKWTPIAHPVECLEYTKKLEASGKYVLTIWPYHTLLGGVSHALVPA